ncbi:hypothetical protein [Clostridium beijerinckii]|uniref:Uncharacterized protein n=1 Tax=Clostridium beijerinckii TaxID=1520 RepID=A0AAE5H6N4_CLOBE|nr:hypothetical protein [Clostridium beijerinckii]NSB15797.1 hypothetical protein [Clostridium beijerinckii]OOM26204.1 hypothetical protein CLOBE_32990 [Clostridium beijerinckii]
MNRLLKRIILSIMIILAFTQILCINNIKKANNIKVYNYQNKFCDHETLKQINRDLDCLNEKNILSANEKDGKWHVKIKISGSKDDLLNELPKLKNYDVNNYIIDKNKNETSIILDISTKESV